MRVAYSAAFARRKTNSSRNANGRMMGRNVGNHQRHRADLGAVADVDAAQDLRIGAELDIVADRRRGPVFANGADRDALAQGAVGAENGAAMNKDIAEMENAQAGADDGVIINADSGQNFDAVKHPPIKPKPDVLYEPWFQLQCTTAKAIDPHRPHGLLFQKGPRRISRQIRFQMGVRHDFRLGPSLAARNVGFAARACKRRHETIGWHDL